MDLLQGSCLQSSRAQGETRREVLSNGRDVVRRTSEPEKERPKTTTHTTNNRYCRRECSRSGEAIRQWENCYDARRALALLLLVADGSLDPQPAPDYRTVLSTSSKASGPDMGALGTPHAVRARQGWAARGR